MKQKKKWQVSKMSEINCEKCTRRKHCFVKEFEVLSCEDYNPEDSAEYEEGSDNGGESPGKNI